MFKRKTRYRNRLIVGGVALVAAVAGVVIWQRVVSREADIAVPQAAASQATNAPDTTAAASPTTPEAPSPAYPAPIPVAQADLLQTTPVRTVQLVQNVLSAPVMPEPASRPAAADIPAMAEPRISISPAATHASTAPATTQVAISAPLIAEAQALAAKGDLLAARQMLNTQIISGKLPADVEAAAKKAQAEINQTLIFSIRRTKGDEWIDSYTVQAGDTLKVLAPKYALTTDFVQRINKISDPRKMQAGRTLKLIKGPFFAVVTKSTFTIDLYLGAPGGEGSLYVCSFPVGLGQNDSTPAGRWEVTPGKKLQHPVYYDPRGQGVVYEPSDPNNPLGDYWIGLTGLDGQAVGKLSYGIHGTNEPDTVGTMSSMGCVRLRNEDVKLVYEMLVESKSTVVVRP